MTSAKLGIIVFARMSSSRLPGKVLMDFGGRPLLAHILARAAAVAQPVIVATSGQAEDDAIAEFAAESGTAVFRGALDDVLQRAVDCAREHRLDGFARLCGDRPYFPQEQMQAGLVAMASSFAEGMPADLFTNHLLARPPVGLSTEIVRVNALQRALDGGATARHREHLTAYLYDHAGSFDIRPVAADFGRTKGHAFAVDTHEDFERLSRVACELADIHATCDMAADSMTASQMKSRN